MITLLKIYLHAGCGFFPEGFFVRGGEKYDAVQVRIVAPTIGLVKGMLLKKKGIDKIQLSHSMIKVNPSQTCEDPWAAVIIKNVFPSEGKQTTILRKLHLPSHCPYVHIYETS